MKLHSQGCRCNCQFVPPFVSEKLAATTGEPHFQISIAQSRLLRQRRSNLITDIDKLEAFISATNAGTTAAAIAKVPSRLIYDSKQKPQQRFQLVRKEGAPPTADSDVNKAYDYAGIVRDFLKNVLNRNSLDNQGMDFILNVHYGQKYNNAFWDGDEVTLGDGDGSIFTSFAQSLDVIAHELGHGIVQFMVGPNLKYEKQAGAINEHLADVFGTAITQYANKQKAVDADWLIGDEIMGPNLYGEALRSMMAPGTAYDNPLMGKDPQPDHMKNIYTGSGDAGGVHINSGILNKVFYLVSMDIDTDKAVLIWYHALLLKKLPPVTPVFNDFVNVVVEASRILTRDKKVPLGSTQSVRSAFKAVGLPTT